jgi:hypothetical protein
MPLENENNNNPIAIYEDLEIDLKLELPIDSNAETLWMTQEQIGQLFSVESNTITYHILNIYGSEELEENPTTRKIRVVRKEGKRSVSREINHYNLDMILSVGYRVSSQKATKFRQWATKILKTYIVSGYVLNEARLAQDPEALSNLSHKLRELRLSEKNVYKQVSECFKISAVDYSSESKAWRSFFAKIQDKFYFAATEMTAPEIKIERADHNKEQMGLTVMEGKKAPRKQEVQIAKNYLDEKEFRTLHIIADLFLTYAESKAIREQSLTMEELISKFDALIEVTEYPLLKEYPVRHFMKVKQAELTVENERQIYIAERKLLNRKES